MKKKALLVGAKAGAVGPYVNFDGGTWEVESHPFVEVEITGGKAKALMDSFKFSGASRLRAIVKNDYKGPDIHLDARQVA